MFAELVNSIYTGPMTTILRIIFIALQHKWKLLLAYLCTIAATISYLIIPKLIGNTLDHVTETSQEGSFSEGVIIWASLLIFGLFILRGIFSYGQTYLGEVIGHLVAYEIRNKFFEHTQKLSYSYHDRHHTGNLMSRAITDTEHIRMFINLGVVRAPYFLSLFIIVSAILLTLNWQLGLVSIIFMPVVALRSSQIRLKMRQIWIRVQQKNAGLSMILQENLTGVRIVKAFAAEQHEELKFDRQNLDVTQETIEAERLNVSNYSFTLFTFQIALGIILWFGGWKVMQTQMSYGDLAQFIIYMQILAMPVRMAGWIVNTYARASAAGSRIFDVLDAEPIVSRPILLRNLSNIKGHIKFENVSFNYGDNTNALKNISFESKPGTITALVGAPGSGKSTVVNLLPRFYEATSGRITIDNIDTKQVTIESLRNNIGIVQQDVFLFSSTIGENIAYGRPNATQSEIVHAAKTAQLHEFIESLENGYNTRIGERGSQLSGGQRQRLSIARAILVNPKLLILDDSASSVDTETEHLIHKAIQAATSKRTTFIIAHRLNSVHKADTILVLDKGKIKETGTHLELIAMGGLYNQIYELQIRPQNETLYEISEMDLQSKGYHLS